MIIQEIAAKLIKPYQPLIPYSRKKKEAFLDRVWDKVAYYKPLMEERCHIDMGNIQ